MNSPTATLSIVFAAISVLFLGTAASIHAQRIPDTGELITAIDTANYRVIDELIGQGTNLDATARNGRTVLESALNTGSLHLVEKLLNSGASPDTPGSDGLSPLMQAVIRSRDDVLVLLLAHGASPNIVADPRGGTDAVSALSLALDRGEFAIARRLVAAGANPLLLADPAEGAENPLNLPKTRIPLDSRIFRSLADIRDAATSPEWEASRNKADDDYQLHRASRTGDWRAARAMLDAGADPDFRDSRGVTPLMTASFHGYPGLVSLLLQRGALIDIRDDSGRTALSYATASVQSDIVRRLLDLNASAAPVTRDTMESSPIYFALATGSRINLDALLNAGAPVDIQDKEGVTPLMVASWLSDVYAVRKLLPLSDRSGPASRDEAGRSALAWSAAAFDRDRSTGRELDNPGRSARNYPVARLLSRRRNILSNPLPQPTTDIEEDVINSWSPGRHPAEADDWRGLLPSPIPTLSEGGDLGLYRIFRDEEPGEIDRSDE